MSEKDSQKRSSAVQTTGHAWDGDLQEFNNPLPRWWLWSFYATAVFAVIYWFIYPAWPVGSSWTRGFSTVSYQVNGEEREVPWNTRAQLIQDLQSSPAAERQREFMQRVSAMEFDNIINDPETLAFARSVGRNLFGDNCAACHGRGGQGVMSLYPNLADDDWLWGGSMERIQDTLIHGRRGFMPAFKETLSPEQLDDVAEYVLSLSGEAQPSDASARGGEIFQGFTGGCYACHGQDAKGQNSLGSANLTDKIWTLANVPAQDSLEAKKTAVKQIIWNGVQGIRIMPAWQDRLRAEEIKLLAVYVHQLGGGQ